MKETFRRLIDAVDAAGHETVIRQAISDFACSLGYNRYAYLQGSGLEVKTFSNYPRPWRRAYLSTGLSAVDPVVEKAKRLKRPFLWTADDWKGSGYSKEVRAFRDRAIQHGLRCGLTIPAEGSYGRILMLTLASDNAVSERTLPDPVVMVSTVLALHYNLNAKSEFAISRPTKLLSPREATCLCWSAKGLHAPEIATVMNVAPGTAQKYLDQMRQKLSAATLPHAVAIGKDQKLC